MKPVKGRNLEGTTSDADKHLKRVRKGFKTLIEHLERGSFFTNRDLEREIFILKKDLQRIREYIEGKRICKDD